MTRTKLADRLLPDYTRSEELMNMVTHIVGGGLGVVGLVLCVLKAAFQGSTLGVVASAIYGGSMILLYTMSSIYHGLHSGHAKKVMQVLDHCTIYFLIAGTYTPVMLCSLLPRHPSIAIGLLIVEWTLAVTAAVFTAIDLHNFRVISMVCYIGMGWGIIFFLPQTLQAVSSAGFFLLLAGGISYTIGAVLYGIGSKKRWMHSVFHVFVVLGSILQYLCVLIYVL